jgi:hypothetical protein
MGGLLGWAREGRGETSSRRLKQITPTGSPGRPIGRKGRRRPFGGYGAGRDERASERDRSASGATETEGSRARAGGSAKIMWSSGLSSTAVAVATVAVATVAVAVAACRGAREKAAHTEGTAAAARQRSQQPGKKDRKKEGREEGRKEGIRKGEVGRLSVTARESRRGHPPANGKIKLAEEADNRFPV